MPPVSIPKHCNKSYFTRLLSSAVRVFLVSTCTYGTPDWSLVLALFSQSDSWCTWDYMSQVKLVELKNKFNYF